MSNVSCSTRSPTHGRTCYGILRERTEAVQVSGFHRVHNFFMRISFQWIRTHNIFTSDLLMRRRSGAIRSFFVLQLPQNNSNDHLEHQNDTIKTLIWREFSNISLNFRYGAFYFPNFHFDFPTEWPLWTYPPPLYVVSKESKTNKNASVLTNKKYLYTIEVWSEFCGSFPNNLTTEETCKNWITRNRLPLMDECRR